MRIRTQNLIAIVPLFLGMAAVAAGMTYSTAREEMLWGLSEEASSLSVAIAEFVDGDELQRATAAGDPAARFEQLALSFERILNHGQAKHIFALTPSGEPIWSVRAEDEASARFVPPAEQLRMSEAASQALLNGDSAIVGDVAVLDSGESVMISFAPITTADGAPAGVLGVVIDAARLPALMRELFTSLARLTVLALVIGTLAALFISALLTHKVRALSKAALQVAGGEYDRQIDIGTIQELSDLSNTFNTMSSVLKDLIERTRRTLIEGEQFRTPLDLARTYRQDGWSDLSREYGGIHVASCSIGEGHPGDLYGVVEREGAVTVFVGRVTEGRELDSAVAAAAARRAIEEGTNHWSVPHVLEEVCRLLHLRIETLSWKPGSEAEAVLATYKGDGDPQPHRIRLDGEQTALLHTFPGRAGDVLHRWKRVFQKMSPDALVENLGRTIEAGAMGTLVAVGREPVAAEPVGVEPVEVF